MSRRIPHASLLLALLPACLLAEINLGSGRINLKATAEERYDSRVNANANSDGAFISSLSPAAYFTRDSALLKTNASLGMGIERSFDNSQLDQETYFASAGTVLERQTLGNFSVNLNANFSKGSVANFDLGQRVQTESYLIAANAVVGTSERTDVSYSPNFSRTKTGAYGKQDTLSNSLEFRFGPFLENANFYTTYSNVQTRSDGRNALGVALDQASDTVSIGVGKPITEVLTARANVGYNWFTSSEQEQKAGTNSTSGMVISGSLSGPFLPQSWAAKTSSSFSISYSDSQSRGLMDTGGKQLAGNMHLTWNARENTSLSFNAGRSRRLTANDMSVDTTSVGISAEERLTSGVSLDAGVSHNWSTYSDVTGNTQKSFVISGGASYGFGARNEWSSRLSANYTNTSSVVAYRNFDRYSVQASLSYFY